MGQLYFCYIWLKVLHLKYGPTILLLYLAETIRFTLKIKLYKSEYNNKVSMYVK